jgi:hypothetical protein
VGKIPNPCHQAGKDGFATDGRDYKKRVGKMTDYVITKTTDWWNLLWIVITLIMGVASIIMFGLLYMPIFIFYMPIYRDTIALFLWLNFVIFMFIFINQCLAYKPKEEKEIIRKGKCNTDIIKDRK